MTPRAAEFHDVESSSVPRAFYGAAFALALAVCWVLPIRNPLSRDETGTYWIVKDGISDAVARSYYWTNWSPYYLIEWFAVHVGGANELVMRVPSVVAMCLAAFLLSRIGALLWDKEAGLLAALVFAVMPDVGFAAGDARPYAFTLVALCGYTWAILRWIENGRLGDALLAGVLAALTAYGHVMIAIGLVVPALYAVWSRPKSWHLPLAFGLTAILVVPLLIQLRAYLGMNTTHFAGYRPVLDDLWAAMASAQFLATIGIGVVFAFVTEPVLRFGWGFSRPVTFFLVSWMVFPPALLFALARTDTAQLFLGRYLLSTAVPQALIYGGLVRSIGPVRARALVLATLLVMSAGAFVFSAKSFHGEGWKDAMAAVRAEVGTSNMPLVMSSPFIEAQTVKNLDDPKLKDVLFAPVFMYPVPARLVRLPYLYDEASLTRVAETELASDRDFVVLTSNPAVPEWLERRLAVRAAHATLVGVFRGLGVYRFRLES